MAVTKVAVTKVAVTKVAVSKVAVTKDIKRSPVIKAVETKAVVIKAVAMEFSKVEVFSVVVLRRRVVPIPEEGEESFRTKESVLLRWAPINLKMDWVLLRLINLQFGYPTSLMGSIPVSG